jgi:hypothetical protein
MEVDKDKCDINENIQSIVAERHDTADNSECQGQAPEPDEATSERSPTNKVPDATAPPVILWRSLMLQQ